MGIPVLLHNRITNDARPTYPVQFTQFPYRSTFKGRADTIQYHFDRFTDFDRQHCSSLQVLMVCRIFTQTSLMSTERMFRGLSQYLFIILCPLCASSNVEYLRLSRSLLKPRNNILSKIIGFPSPQLWFSPNQTVESHPPHQRRSCLTTRYFSSASSLPQSRISLMGCPFLS